MMVVEVGRGARSFRSRGILDFFIRLIVDGEAVIREENISIYVCRDTTFTGGGVFTGAWIAMCARRLMSITFTVDLHVTESLALVRFKLIFNSHHLTL